MSDPGWPDDRTARGAVYGLHVWSPEPLRYLREVGAGDTGRRLDILAHDDGRRPSGEPLRRWLPRPENPFRASLFADRGAYRLWIDGLGWYRIDPQAGEIWMPPHSDPLRREERLYGIPLAIVLARHGALPLHASAVQIGDAAVAFAAPGRHGKTTLAAALTAAGHRLLSEDLSCCAPGTAPVAVPGPALLRVRPDAFERLSISATEVTLADADRVHLAVRPEARGDCTPVPLRALLLLRRTEDRVAVASADPHLAIRDLWSLSMKLPTDEDRARCFAGITELVDRVPVYDLFRPNRWDLLPDIVARVVEVVGS